MRPIAIFALLIAGCADDGPATYLLAATPTTTLQQTWAPKQPPASVLDLIDDGELLVIDHPAFDDNGLGIELIGGEPWNLRDDLATGASDGTTRRSLAYFWHASDPQIADEESPIRFEGIYKVSFKSTYRPQSHLTTQIFEAHVRSINRIAKLSDRGIDFGVITGDLSDGGQRNELDWAATILAGGVINPDSGASDNPASGAGNDATDPFISEGLSFPWYAVLGNHEVLYMGIFEPTDDVKAAATGDTILDYLQGISSEGFSNGARDASTIEAKVIASGKVVADSAREILSLQGAIAALADAPGEPAGHGFADDQARTRGYYSVRPIADRPLRLIVLSTLQQIPANSDGAIDGEQRQWLEGELQAAEANQELVIVASHHGPLQITSDSPTSGDDLAQLLASHENVILHLIGHGHVAQVRAVGQGPNRGYWELMVPSTIDFPSQTRLIELVHEGNGSLSVYATNVEANVVPTSLAHDAVRLAASRGFFEKDDFRDVWAGRKPSRNLKLRIAIPAAIDTLLSQSTLPAVIASEETLNTL